MTMEKYYFASAAPDEQIVYGACRPDYPSKSPNSRAVNNWISRMKRHDIERVCCLLSPKVEYIDSLIKMYRDAFGSQNVCHASIEDYEVVSDDTLHEVILPFLEEAEQASEKVVVHCSAGMGRTGHVLALWLVYGQEYELEEAIQTVEKMGRRPLEAVTVEQLRELC